MTLKAARIIMVDMAILTKTDSVFVILCFIHWREKKVSNERELSSQLESEHVDI